MGTDKYFILKSFVDIKNKNLVLVYVGELDLFVIIPFVHVLSIDV